MANSSEQIIDNKVAEDEQYNPVKKVHNHHLPHLMKQPTEEVKIESLNLIDCQIGGPGNVEVGKIVRVADIEESKYILEVDSFSQLTLRPALSISIRGNDDSMSSSDDDNSKKLLK